MIVSYCKKCNLESSGAICQNCGKKASVNAVRDVWRTVRVPVADIGAWKNAGVVVLVTCVVLLAVLLTAERLMSTSASFAATSGSLIAAVILALLIGIALVFGLLALQGREEVRYSLNMEGACMQTWYRASRLRAWARLQHVDMGNTVAAADGVRYFMADERRMAWQDVNEIKYSPSTGTIRLYHTPHLAPFVLRLPPEEYDTAEAIVKKYTKRRA
ncbi:MAG: hypothetical protein IJ240_09375 [Clostridia bacterium]|nr:hypothetical protein [Clostridia bacterium]